jgi:N-dimethylarginine dimethylaminohydrolase
VTIELAEPADGTAAAVQLRSYVMCPPTYFAVNYSINPWMRPGQPVNPARAQRQWKRLYRTLGRLGHHVDLIAPQPDLPDMVFAANGGIVIADRALVPRFRHPERRAESRHFADAFTSLGLTHVQQAQHVNEGEGDFLLAGGHLLAGNGFRSDPRAADEVADYFGMPTVRLTLVDPRLYHLDTALGVLSDELIVYWPEAFHRASQGVLRELYPDAILAGAEDAAELGLNIVSDGRTAITAPACTALASQIAERGLRVIPLPVDELNKAGGGAKCCVLTRHRAIRSAPAAR